MLVEYCEALCEKAAKSKISKIDKNTLKALPVLSLAGKHSRIQNIIERYAIPLHGDTFWIDEGWLSSQGGTALESQTPLNTDPTEP